MKITSRFFILIMSIATLLLADEVLVNVTKDTWGLISNQKLVYTDYHYLTATTFWMEVNLVDIKSKVKSVLFPITNTYPYYVSFGLSGYNLAFIPYYSGGGGGSSGSSSATYLQYKNIQTGTTQQLITNSAWKEMVWVGGEVVTWVDYRYRVASTADSQNSEIFIYNLTTKQESRITSDHSYQSYPCTDGKNVVWIDYTSSYGKLLMHTIATGETKEIASYPAGKNNPRISGNIIVWEDYRNTANDPKNVDIYMYDLATSTEKAVCSSQGFQGRIYALGNHIVWEDYRNATVADPTNVDIYGYNIITNEEKPLVLMPGYQAHPTLSGDTLCWFDKSSGLMSLIIKDMPTSISLIPNIKKSTTNTSLSLYSNGSLLIRNFNSNSQISASIIDVRGRIIVKTNGQADALGLAKLTFGKHLSHGVYQVLLKSDNHIEIHKAFAW